MAGKTIHYGPIFRISVLFPVSNAIGFGVGTKGRKKECKALSEDR